MRYVTIDGMMSGTGIRDSIEGGYLEPKSLGVPPDLERRLSRWLSEYTEAHYDQYQDGDKVRALDEEGLRICVLLQQELTDAKVEYFSSAKMTKIPTPSSA